MMRNSDFLRRQAEVCTALSRSTFDLTLAGRLRIMAAELCAQAQEDDHEQFPAHWTERSGSSKQKHGR